MEDVVLIYHNELGLAFRWKNTVPNADYERIQVVFRNMSFYLLQEEISKFSQNIRSAQFYNCSDCKANKSCRNILLKTPLEKMDISLNMQELSKLSDLVEGTLFKLDLQDYIWGAGRN
ncbi:hypothetical protein GCM10007103_17660 [Salinimicrobium marinum]|uniref:Uncharacterized protein n=2 Tax=Salinimicrobium marinum TaxID=680283 RepID=A0A918VZ55_9FLAO|nr:hypothetical protein GCM10007103_17660 [Salinimicrobium marinum]